MYAKTHSVQILHTNEQPSFSMWIGTLISPDTVINSRTRLPRDAVFSNIKNWSRDL